MYHTVEGVGGVRTLSCRIRHREFDIHDEERVSVCVCVSVCGTFAMNVCMIWAMTSSPVMAMHAYFSYTHTTCVRTYIKCVYAFHFKLLIAFQPIAARTSSSNVKCPCRCLSS